MDTQLWIKSLFKIGKQNTGLCCKYGSPETVEHVLLKCVGYNNDRSELLEEVKTVSVGIKRLTLKNNNSKVPKALLEYLKKACLIRRI